MFFQQIYFGQNRILFAHPGKHLLSILLKKPVCHCYYSLLEKLLGITSPAEMFIPVYSKPKKFLGELNVRV